MLGAEHRASGPQVAGRRERRQGRGRGVLDVPVQALGEAEKLAQPVDRETSSSSVAAGDVRQSIAFTFSAAVRNSARIPGSLPEMAK